MASSRLLVRAAKAADFEALLGFHRALYADYAARAKKEDGRSMGGRSFQKAVENDLRSTMNDPRTIVLVVEKDEVTIGYVTARVVSRGSVRVGVMEDWYVVPDARGAGAGRLLVETLERALVKKGCAHIESSTPTTNETSRKVHAKLGFEEVEVRFRRPLR